MKNVRTHNGKVLSVPNTPEENLREASRVATRSWRLLVESLDQLQQAEVLFAERTQYVKDKLGVTTLTVEAVKERELDEQWKSSIADAQYALQRMQAMSGAYGAARSRLEDIREMHPELFLR